MGPYAGLIVAVPAAAWGLSHSMPIEDPIFAGGGYWFGSSILFGWLEALFSPNGADVVLHPVGFAGWVGLFVTSLNLIPASQLDGGHIAYALFGKNQIRVSILVVAGLLATGLFLYTRSGIESGFVWIFWSLLLFVIGLRHPPVADETLPLSNRQRLNGGFALLLFVLTFVPVPIQVLEPGSRIPGSDAPSDQRNKPTPTEEFKL
jgi:membrane-associated protease RseP (regulator of RpoE activity)